MEGGIAMLDHVTIRVTDRSASEAFYDTVLRTLGVERTTSGESFTEWAGFSLAAATAEHAVTRRLHIGFAAPSRERVDAFWRAGTAAGYRDDGAGGRLRAGHQVPGFAQFRSDGGSFCLLTGTPSQHLHMAFAAADGTAPVLDPDGNRVELVSAPRRGPRRTRASRRDR